MSAPVVDRPRTGGSTRTGPATARPTPPRRTSAQRDRTSAGPRRTARTDDRPARAVAPGRAKFALTVMALLGVGLVATLWLSTAAAADSYRLQDARTAARELSERSERLHRDVAVLQSAPALAQRAGELGMVPAENPARLVVASDGAVEVVGEPRAAVAPRPGAQPVGVLPGTAPPPGAAAPAGASVEAASGSFPTEFDKPRAAVESAAAAAVAAARPVVEARVAARKAEEEAARLAAEQAAAEAAAGQTGGEQAADLGDDEVTEEAAPSDDATVDSGDGGEGGDGPTGRADGDRTSADTG
jgi:hypothetical protein